MFLQSTIKVQLLLLRFNTFSFQHTLSCVATRVFSVRSLHAVDFSKKLRWLALTKVITLETQLYAVNARWKRVPQRSFRNPIRWRCKSNFQKPLTKLCVCHKHNKWGFTNNQQIIEFCFWCTCSCKAIKF
jgi:hypothetical protein